MTVLFNNFELRARHTAITPYHKPLEGPSIDEIWEKQSSWCSTGAEKKFNRCVNFLTDFSKDSKIQVIAKIALLVLTGVALPLTIALIIDLMQVPSIYSAMETQSKNELSRDVQRMNHTLAAAPLLSHGINNFLSIAEEFHQHWEESHLPQKTTTLEVLRNQIAEDAAIPIADRTKAISCCDAIIQLLQLPYTTEANKKYLNAAGTRSIGLDTNSPNLFNIYEQLTQQKLTLLEENITMAAEKFGTFGESQTELRNMIRSCLYQKISADLLMSIRDRIWGTTAEEHLEFHNSMYLFKEAMIDRGNHKNQKAVAVDFDVAEGIITHSLGIHLMHIDPMKSTKRLVQTYEVRAVIDLKSRKVKIIINFATERKDV